MSRRHSLTKAYQPRSKRSPQQDSRPPTWSAARTAKRLWRRGWPWLIVLVVISLIGFGFRYYNFGRFFSSVLSPQAAARSNSVQTVPTTLAASTPTPTPTPVIQNWQTLRTFTGSNTGSGTAKTQTFVVPTTSVWQMTWSCQGLKGVDDYLYIVIYNANGSLYNSGAQVTCVAAHRVVQSAQEAKGGTFYLTIDANTPWTITIQVPSS